MMSPENLAIVLAPSIIRSPDSDPLSSLANAKSERTVVEYLVSDYHYLLEEVPYVGPSGSANSTTSSNSSSSSAVPSAYIPTTAVSTHLR